MFKAGDKVAVYGLNNHLEPVRVVSTVIKVEDGMVHLDEKTSYRAPDYDFSLAHPKQCRKIRHKELR